MFWTLLLAHLSGDYLLQTDSMAQDKKHWRGLIRHVLVHLGVLLLLAGAPAAVAGVRIWPQLLTLAIVHFVIDSLKNSANARWPHHLISFYLLDQAVHLISLLLVASWIERETGLRTDRPWTIYATAYLAVTHVWFITERLLAHGNPSYRAQIQDQRWWRIVVRAAALTVYLLAGRALLAAPASGVAVAATVHSIPYLSGSYRHRALLVDLLVPLLTAVIVLFSL